ncbi:hairy and enhancer of split-related protein HELT [Pelobates fuscus]|uniref:hairy and enhancer of split-related protein HELT n=1 Tax=Pelobates fuscus TaxID=191477 RepID=UPI002FE44184
MGKTGVLDKGEQRARIWKRAPVSHKVIEKRRRDRINRCLSELGKTVPMALAKQNTGKLEKAEILEMTVQYLRALHAADFPRGRDKDLLSEFANYFHYGYHECMKNLVHYLTTVERMETKDTKYARIVAFLQSKAHLTTEPLFSSLQEADVSCQLHSSPPDYASPCDSTFTTSPSGPFSWHSTARSPTLNYLTGPAAMPLPCTATQQPPHSSFLSPMQSLDRHYVSLLGHSHPNSFSMHAAQHPSVL